jgi:hypothetical protein
VRMARLCASSADASLSPRALPGCAPDAGVAFPAGGAAGAMAAGAASPDAEAAGCLCAAGADFDLDDMQLPMLVCTRPRRVSAAGQHQLQLWLACYWCLHLHDVRRRESCGAKVRKWLPTASM